MRILGQVSAALIAAAVVICDGHGALAEDPANGEAIERYLLSGGFDLWRDGGFAHGGLLWSPGGLGREGFTFKLLIGGGGYRYHSGTDEIRGGDLLAAAMPGWRFKSDRFEFTIYGGLDLQWHRLVPDDPASRVRGAHAGVRVGGDAWYEPTHAMMIAASLSASTVGSNLWSRAAIGWRVPDWAWFGPEVQAFTDGRYRQFRAGAHVTAFKTGRFEWSAGAGYARDSDHRAGPYGRIGILVRR